MKNLMVCLISPDPIGNGGGMDVSQKRISNFLADIGFTVHFVRFAPFTDIRLTKNTTVTRIPSWRNEIECFDITPVFSLSGNSFAWMEITKGLEELIQIYKYKVLHGLHISYSGFTVTLLGKKYSIPTILSGRGSDLNKNIYSEDFFSKTLWSLEKADKLTFVSHSMLQKANIFFPCIDKSSVIYNSTSEDLFTPNIERMKKNTNPRFVIGGNGVLDDKKGVNTLIFLIEKLLESNIRFEIYWIGTRGEKSGIRYIDRLKKYEDQKLIKYSGIIPHRLVLRELKKLDIFISLSPDEGCPNAILEAMLAKIPIIAPRIGAIPEIINDEKEALLIPPYDYEAAYNAIIRLISDEKLKTCLVQNSYQKVKSKFNPTIESNAWKQIYENTFKSNGK